MRKNEIRTAVLRILLNNKLHGYEIHKILTSKGLNIDVSRLYKLLNEMQENSIVESHWKNSSIGPKKRIYQISVKGKEELQKMLLNAIRIVHQFYNDYIMNLPPKLNALNMIGEQITSHLNGKGRIAYLTMRYSKIQEKFVNILLNKLTQGMLYLVKPSSVKMDLNHKRLSLLDGDYNNLPLKDDFLDLLVILRTPPYESLETSLIEWNRVVGRGMVALLIPSVFTKQISDPMTIGDFIEKNEYLAVDQSKFIDYEFLNEMLGKFFPKIAKKEIAHMTVLLASKL
jgi:PadR family transcriptional regulator PadR